MPLHFAILAVLRAALVLRDSDSDPTKCHIEPELSMMLVDCLAQLLTIGGALGVSDGTSETNFRCLRLGRKKIISIHLRTSSQSRPLHLIIGSLIH